MFISKEKVPIVSSMPERFSDVRNVAILKGSILNISTDDRRQTTDDERQVMAIVHLDHWSR
jgi:hypothetical protein